MIFVKILIKLFIIRLVEHLKKQVILLDDRLINIYRENSLL